MTIDMGARIKECRNRANMTQKELAERLGMKEAAISKWENNVVENIPRSTIKDMAKLFDVNPCYLMAFSDNPHIVGTEPSIFDRVVMELGTDASDLLKQFSSMNEKGKTLALQMLNSLVCDPSNVEQTQKGDNKRMA